MRPALLVCALVLAAACREEIETTGAFTSPSAAARVATCSRSAAAFSSVIPILPLLSLRRPFGRCRPAPHQPPDQPDGRPGRAIGQGLDKLPGLARGLGLQGIE